MPKITLTAIRRAFSIVVALVLSYMMVGFLLERSEAKLATPEELRVARELRGLTNELIALLDEFTAKRPGDRMADIVAFEKWAARNFHPRANDLRQRLVHSDFANKAHTDLLAATDRLAALASRPRDDRLVEAASRAVTKAAAQTERYIAQFNASDSVMPRPLIPSIAQR